MPIDMPFGDELEATMTRRRNQRALLDGLVAAPKPLIIIPATQPVPELVAVSTARQTDRPPQA